MTYRKRTRVGGFFESGDKCQRLILEHDDIRLETWFMLLADDGVGNGVKFRDLDRFIVALQTAKVEAVKRGWT